MSPTELGAAALSVVQAEQAAGGLEHARRHQAPIVPLTSTCPALDVAGAYAIQRAPRIDHVVGV